MTSAAYIAGYVRSPFTFAKKGALAAVRPDDLGAHVIRALLARTGVAADEIEDVVWGCAFPEGEQGINIGRIVGMLAGLPNGVGGVTVNRWCGSAIQAVQMAAGMLTMNAGEAFIAGGTESMSKVPMMGFNLQPHPTWTKEQVDDYCNVGITAERVARLYGLTREDQDRFGLASQQKAFKAQQAGLLAAEIEPFVMGDLRVEHDGCVRDTSLEKMATLKPAFLEGGSVTAATSSPMTDGATAVLVCSEEFLKRHDIVPLARIASFAISGCAPGLMGLGPIASSRKALKRAGLRIHDIDVVEMNEAFASQAEACRRDLEIDPAKLNIDGGAIAIGHPLGASGARIATHLTHVLRTIGKKYALGSACIGGGQGIAIILESMT